MGHRRRPAGARHVEALWLGDGAQRPYPSDRAEGRRQYDLPHCTLDLLPAAGPWYRAFARAHDGAGRPAPLRARHYQRLGAGGRQASRHIRQHARALICTMSSLHVKIAVLATAVLMLWVAPGLAEDAKIKIANFTFDPPTLTVKAGTTVTWVNADDIPHVVSEKNGTFRSNALDTDESFTQT